MRTLGAVGGGDDPDKCPFCGWRDHSEFTYAGDATKVARARLYGYGCLADFVYLRDNPKGCT